VYEVEETRAPPNARPYAPSIGDSEVRVKARNLCALGAALALAIGTVSADPAFADQAVSIPDPDLRLCITRGLQLEADAPLTESRLGGIRSLTCNDSGFADLDIKSLAGLEHLTNVQALYLNRGSVTDLAPLAGLSELWAVHLHANQVSDLHPLAGLHKLSLLDLAEDPIGDLAPILALPALSTLDISGTKVDASQIVAMPALRNLTIGGLPSSDYGFLAGMDKLGSLTIVDDKITSLKGIPMPPLVSVIFLAAPAVTSLAGIEAASELQRFYAFASDTEVDRTALSDISALAGLKKLIQVDIEGSEVADVSGLADKPVLTEIVLEKGRVTDLKPLASTTHLRRLWVGQNQIRSLEGLEGMHDLTELTVHVNAVASLEPIRGLTIKTLDANANAITDVGPIADMQSLETVVLGYNLLQDVSPLAGLTSQPRLDLSRNHISDLSAFSGWTKSVLATDQDVTAPAGALAGVAGPLGVRNQAGSQLCATNADPRVTCKDGQITYPTSGTYRSFFSDAGDNPYARFSGTVTQYAGPDKPFTRTHTPKVFGGPEVGLSVIADFKPWTPAVSTYTYQWYRDGTLITGPASNGYFYNAVPADRGRRLSVCVTGHLDGYEAKRLCSAPSARVVTGSLRAPKPKISGDDVTESTLTAVTGDWTVGTTLRYQWQRNNKNIRGATAATFRLRAGDVGDHIRVRITGSQAGYHSSTRYSATITPRKAAFVAENPQVTGTPTVGQVLTVQPSAWSPEPTHLSYRWYRDGASLKGATKTTYRLTAKDAGTKITVKVTGSRAGYRTRSVSSTAVVPVAA